MKIMNYQIARNFVYRNARPLDIARWKFLFENGSQEDVLKALAEYQNEDGGFAHALEPDSWNPNSSPIQTWVATEIISEIKLKNKNHPIIQGILRYLGSGDNFDGHTWFNTITSNNDYPHAAWWDYQPTQSVPYNPTASLIGFLLTFTEVSDPLYSLACRLAKEAYFYFKQVFPTDSMSTATCFVNLYEYLKEAAIQDLIDMQEFCSLLQQQITYMIEYDTEKWKTEYICKPSQFIKTKSSEFYMMNKDICEFECEFISNNQNSDGTWNINWTWDRYPEEWHISKNWWKSDWIIKNIKFYQEFCSDSINIHE